MRRGDTRLDGGLSGHGHDTARSRGSGPDRRTLVWAAEAVLLGVLVALTLGLGRLGVGPGDVLDLVRGEASRKVAYVLTELRGPRVLVAIGAGAALGLAGALFQVVTRNPLGSPDVLGISSGAGAGVAVASVLAPVALGGPVGALLGAGVTLAALWFFTGNGFSSTGRIIIAGIAVNALAISVTQFVLTATRRDQSAELAGYLVGSLGTRNLGHVALVWTALVLALPVLAWLAHRFRVMELGDTLSTVLGSPAVSTRTVSVFLAVGLAAFAVAACGPIAFVALMSPHIARGLAGPVRRGAGTDLFGSALTGALVLVSSDLLVTQVPALDGLPVGIVTAGVGGLYLGALLVHRWRQQN